MKQVQLTNTNWKSVHQKMSRVLKDGGLVIAPSDSVYGALVDATNQDAVEKLIGFKARPRGKPISVFVADMDMLQKYGIISESHRAVLARMLPGPFTVALPTRHTLVPLLESENGTIGLRYPDYPFITDFVAMYGKPVTATSANLASRPPHYSISSLLSSLSQKKRDMIDLIIDAGTLPHNKPSTVIDLSGQEIQTIRSGDIQFASQDSFVTSSPEQTHKTGQFFANKIIKNKASQKPIIVVLQGNLGAGKTQFVKGMAAHFEIDDVISPTYVVSYEYDIVNNPYIERFIHADLYNIESAEEIQHIGLHEASHRSIVCIEWGEKLGSSYPRLVEKAHVFHISIGYESETKRLIQIAEQP